jgi:hypothetical protein
MDKNVEALTKLEAWVRKHRSYSVATGSNCQPGDGLTVTLQGAKNHYGDESRRVVVGDYELWDHGSDKFPSIADVILEALKRWDGPQTITVCGP